MRERSRQTFQQPSGKKKTPRLLGVECLVYPKRLATHKLAGAAATIRKLLEFWSTPRYGEIESSLLRVSLPSGALIQ